VSTLYSYFTEVRVGANTKRSCILEFISGKLYHQNQPLVLVSLGKAIEIHNDLLTYLMMKFSGVNIKTTHGFDVINRGGDHMSKLPCFKTYVDLKTFPEGIFDQVAEPERLVSNMISHQKMNAILFKKSDEARVGPP
jgi:hypothetical protein